MSNKIQQAQKREDALGPRILKGEICQALKELKLGKAEGIDCLPAEFLKTLGEKAKEELRSKGRGTRDAISVLRCLGERSLEHGKDLYMFCRLQKSF